MQQKKLQVTGFWWRFPLLLLSGAALISAACTRSNESPVTAGPSPSTTNTDTMSSSGNKTYLALGDSYTIGTSVPESDSYPFQTTALIKAQGIALGKPDIIATNGWTTGDLLYALKDKPLSNSYDAVSLLIGVNNQYQGRTLDEYKQQFTQLLQRSIQLAGGNAAHVFVISIPDYSVTPFAKGRDVAAIAAEIDAFNEANRFITASYKANYLSITAESRKAATDLSLVASDGLHFSGKEYGIWSSQLAPLLRTALH